METSNSYIVNFYKKHQNIDFEKVNICVIDLIEKFMPRMNGEIGENNENINHIMQPIHKLLCSSEERITQNMAIQENNQAKFMNDLESILKISKLTNEPQPQPISKVLVQMFSTGEIQHQRQYENQQVYLLKRYSKCPILFESVYSDDNISLENVQEFSKRIEHHNCSGIFLSQNSGIATKQNYQIDYNHGNVIVYIHNAEYCPDKIKSAIQLVDHLSVKLKELNQNTNESSIPKAVLDDINKEYLLFISQKEALIGVYKVCQKKVLSQIDEIRFPCLDKYLSTKYTAQPTKQGFKCDMCKAFNANNLKALAAHKRGCARKNNNTVVLSTIR